MTPLEIAHALIAAENAHDATQAVALFAEDASIKLAFTPEPFTTREKITAWQAELVAEHIHITPQTIHTEGQTVHWQGSLALDRLRKQGIETVAAEWVITIDNNLIQTFEVKLLP